MSKREAEEGAGSSSVSDMRFSERSILLAEKIATSSPVVIRFSERAVKMARFIFENPPKGNAKSPGEASQTPSQASEQKG